jgi:hypothetical protein
MAVVLNYLPFDVRPPIKLGASLCQQGVLVAFELTSIGPELPFLYGKCNGLRLVNWLPISVGNV